MSIVWVWLQISVADSRTTLYLATFIHWIIQHDPWIAATGQYFLHSIPDTAVHAFCWCPFLSKPAQELIQYIRSCRIQWLFSTISVITCTSLINVTLPIPLTMKHMIATPYTSTAIALMLKFPPTTNHYDQIFISNHIQKFTKPFVPYSIIYNCISFQTGLLLSNLVLACFVVVIVLCVWNTSSSITTPAVCIINVSWAINKLRFTGTLLLAESSIWSTTSTTRRCTFQLSFFIKKTISWAF